MFQRILTVSLSFPTCTFNMSFPHSSHLGLGTAGRRSSVDVTLGETLALAPTVQHFATSDERREFGFRQARMEGRGLIAPPRPTLALGILSSAQEQFVARRGGETTGKFARRRQVIRTSWLRFPNVNDTVHAHFVLRCGGLDLPTAAAIAFENSSGASDLLCASVPASDGRVRGPLLALWWWLRYAYERYPRAGFIGKADDDVFVHLPDAERFLLAVPSDAAPNAVCGVIVYYQLTTAPGVVEIHSFGTTAKHSRNHKTPSVLRCNGESDERRSIRSSGNHSSSGGDDGGGGVGSRGLASPASHASTPFNSPHKRCFGPFPLPCGPFYALGRGVVGAMLAADGNISDDLQRIKALPSSNHRILDDVWLGSILWRFVGGSLPVALFTIDARGPLYHDRADKFRAQPSEVVWHNRLKFVNRVRVLSAFHTARNGSNHCSLAVRWRRIRSHCCALKGGKGSSDGGRGYASSPGHGWPLFFGTTNASECKARHPSRGQPTDLRKKWHWKSKYGIDLDPSSNSLYEKA